MQWWSLTSDNTMFFPCPLARQESASTAALANVFFFTGEAPPRGELGDKVYC